MSKSDQAAYRAVDFDHWIGGEFRRSDGFTALVILVAIADVAVTPLRSTYFHVIGDDVDWARTSAMLASAGVSWDGAVFSPLASATGGPVGDAEARAALRLFEREVIADRLRINEAHFFDRLGRRMKIEEAQLQ